MDVVVRVSPAAARQLREGVPASDDVAGLLGLVAGLGGELRPQHPGVTDPALMRWFVLSAADDRAAAAWASALREHPEVDAAYVTPAAELP